MSRADGQNPTPKDVTPESETTDEPRPADAAVPPEKTDAKDSVPSTFESADVPADEPEGPWYAQDFSVFDDDEHETWIVFVDPEGERRRVPSDVYAEAARLGMI